MQPTDLPVSFQGDTSLFFGAMFAMMSVACLSFASLTSLVWYHRRRLDQWNTPAAMYRVGIAGLLVGIISGVVPDVAYMAAWGEVTPHIQGMIANIDRIFDTLAAIPIIAGLAILTISGPQVIYQLIREPLPFDVTMGRAEARNWMVIVGIIMALALLVAGSK